MGSPYGDIPVHTRDTAVWVRGMPQCAKIKHHTRTRATRFGITAGLPIPVPNPTHHGTPRTHTAVLRVFSGLIQ